MKYTLFFLILSCCFSSLLAQESNESWKIYKNDVYHFCIEYPPYCSDINTSKQISDSLRKVSQRHRTLSFWEDKMLFTVNFGNESIPIISVIIFDNIENIDLQAFSKNVVRYYPGLYQDNEFTINDFATKDFNGINIQYKNKVGGYDGIRKDVFIKKDNRIFAIMIFNPLNADFNTLFKKLMDSFKFTN